MVLRAAPIYANKRTSGDERLTRYITGGFSPVHRWPGANPIHTQCFRFEIKYCKTSHSQGRNFRVGGNVILCVYLIFLKCVWHLGGCVALNHTQTLKSTRLGFSLVSCNWIIIESPQVAQITLCRQSVSHHPGRALFIIFCTPFSAREVCRYTSVYHNVFLAERTSTEGIIYRNDLDSNSSSNRDCLGQLSRLRYPRFEVYYISWKPALVSCLGQGPCFSKITYCT